MGILLVFSQPDGPMSTDVTLLDVGSHMSPETAAQPNGSRDSVVVPESVLPPMPEADSVVPEPEVEPEVRHAMNLLEVVSSRIQVEEVDASVGTPSNRNRSRYRPHRHHAHARATGKWTPTQANVQQRLEQQASEAATAKERVEAHVAARSKESARDLATLAHHCYAEGAPEVAESLERSSSRLISFDDAPIDLTVTATFRRRGMGGGDIELAVTRSSDYAQALAVSFPPGTYGESISRAEGRRSSRIFPKAQDLAFLRAPVVLFEAGQVSARIDVPVACASFGVSSPKADHPYALTRFRRGSKVEKLLVAICAGPEKRDSQAQLAVWIARNDLGRDRFNRRSGGLRTFHDYQSIGEGDSQGAADLLLKGGVDPHRTRFFPQPPAERAPAPVKKKPVERTPQPQRRPEVDVVG